MGVGTLEPLPEIDGNPGEPACKRYRMLGEDGQSYILSVAGKYRFNFGYSSAWTR